MLGTAEVLVVEDDSPIRAMLADVLHDAGYQVVEATNGLEAIEHLRERRPDLIVLDLMLPRMSGWQFLERSRAILDQNNIPVIVLSAIRGHGDYPATLGVAAWFSKPLDVERFVGVVNDLTSQASQAATRRHVLIVEDEVSVRDMITEYLEGEGYMPDVAGSVDEARRRIAEERPDIILLDLMLPDEDGWQFLRTRRDDPHISQTPVLVISAAPHQRLLEAKELGADGFLSKPFDLDLLSALLRSFVAETASG
jgi:DNA-binding response OmpR family regulator